MDEDFREAALEYHRSPKPGKIAIRATKSLETQRDLALAYSPGVAAACEEIEKDPLKALDYTSRGNLVAVITNGTAVLGLGDIGALASKPVMEGKAVLFKKFANVDAIDIEVNQTDTDKLVDTIAALEPSFGGINLEDIAAPACFEVERKLRERLKIPVFHDDQHGTAIIVGAAIVNWLHLSGRDIKKVKLVANGAGAAAIACLNMLVALGLPRENIIAEPSPAGTAAGCWAATDCSAPPAPRSTCWCRWWAARCARVRASRKPPRPDRGARRGLIAARAGTGA